MHDNKIKKYHIVIDENTRYIIELEAHFCGDDLQVVICGGTEYHIGAVALAVPVYEYHGKPADSATVNSLCLFGHKDDEIARYASKYLSITLKSTVSVTAGVHIDAPTKHEIEHLMENCKIACEKLSQTILADSIEDKIN